jgi:hypothetical protein
MEDNRKVIEALESKDTEEKLFPNEQEKELTQPISEEEFKKQIHQAAINNYNKVIENFEHGILHLRDYSGVKEFKSIKRAIKRGHVSIFGDVYPKRPFNNKKRGLGSVTYEKRRLYEQFTHKNRAVC